MSSDDESWRASDTGSTSSEASADASDWSGESLGERWVEEGGDVEEEPDLTPGRAGELLVQLLIELLCAGHISAKLLCTICYYVWKAGAQSEAIREFSYNPDAQSGKFQKHVDRKMGVSTRSPSMYTLKVPGHARGTALRTYVTTPAMIPYEELLK